MLPIRPRPCSEDPAKVARVATSLVATGMNAHLAGVLAARGVASPDEARGRYRLMHYASMRGVDDMATVLASAIKAREPLVVVADYDCDGATACSIAIRGLRALGGVVDFVVPNRFKHGYGLTPEVVDIVADRKPRPRWIITVDNGIASNAGVDHANRLGMGVLVTDHHLPGDTLPDARAIVDPSQPGCTFPSRNLAGCGVMYYVLAATRDRLAAEGWLHADINLASLLDLVALGTVADVVRLDANNRWLVSRGLARIRADQTRPGVRALFDAARRRRYLAASSDFGFSLGPRINAAGRLADMSVGIRCLLSDDPSVAARLAAELCETNERRRDIEKVMHASAKDAMDVSGQAGRFTRVVASDDFHEGVIGIVAGRIKEESNVPTVVFAGAQESGFLKGSGRSIPGVHLRDTLDLVHKRGHDLFHRFGGHAMAAGVTLDKARLPIFRQLFEEASREVMDGNLPEKVLYCDGELPDEALMPGAAAAFHDTVWGQGFEEPVWTGTFKVEESRLVGKDANHVKMRVSRNGISWNAMHFFSQEEPVAGSELTLAYRLGYNEFRGDASADLLVVDRA